jgi:hypothetical protein
MRAPFMPVLCEEALPWSLRMRFELEERDRLLAVLASVALHVTIPPD